MNDEETAEATALAISKFSDLINKLAGPMAEEFGIMLGDKVRVYRVKNWIKTVEKMERLFREAGLSANAVPPRLLLPIMQASSVEDNETLQDMWAGLLATASQETDAVSPSFVETLKQLNPDEARHLQWIHANPLETSSLGVISRHWGGPANVSFDTYERLGLIRRVYVLTKPGPEPFQLARVAKMDIDHDWDSTDYFAKFMQACQGPSAASSESDATTHKSDQ